MGYEKGHVYHPPKLPTTQKGISRQEASARRCLAQACREAASDEQIAGWLLAIAAGQDPWARKATGDKAPVFSTPPDWVHRLSALKMFLERRDGQPMQAVVLQAEIKAAAALGEVRGVIDVDALDRNAAAVLRAGLRAALATTDGALEREASAEVSPGGDNC